MSIPRFSFSFKTLNNWECIGCGFPDPVGAMPKTSCLLRIRGIASFWILVGLLYPLLFIDDNKYEAIPKSLNDIK